MKKTIILDGSNARIIRTAILNDKQELETYLVEDHSFTQIRGNIYLATIERIEPALQAAFVDYGGERYGFLPFSDVHPGYYKIPVADQERLLSALRAEQSKAPDNGELVPDDADTHSPQDGSEATPLENSENTENSENIENPESAENAPDADLFDHSFENDHIDFDVSLAHRQKLLRQTLGRTYRIQEVLHRKQVVLVQAIKDERGLKGPGMTTYISLPGRYCVFLPNSVSRSGVSKKVQNTKDRAKLRTILNSLKPQEGSSVIIRTASSRLSKANIQRDLSYLQKLWESITETTVSSMAPTLVHKESTLIRRVVRDYFDSDCETMMIAGKPSFDEARAIVKAIVPSYLSRVKQYKDETVPLFSQYVVEPQIAKLFLSRIPLPSGGSIVISPTEALVAIDVNSGRSSREADASKSALKTNLEAAAEIALNIRLRDLAGLIVVDFIDMREYSHRRQVEREFEKHLKADRAMMRVGPISQFGLVEMTRQRSWRGLHEVTTTPCPECTGTGYVLNSRYILQNILASIEHTAQEVAAYKILLSPQLGAFLLNQGWESFASLESRHQIRIVLEIDPNVSAHSFLLYATRNRSDAAKPNADTERMVLLTPFASAAGTEKKSSRRRRGSRKSAKAKAEAAVQAGSSEQSQTANTETDTKSDSKSDTMSESGATQNARDRAPSEASSGESAPRKRSSSGRGRRPNSAKPRSGAAVTDATVTAAPATDAPAADAPTAATADTSPAPTAKADTAPRKRRPRRSVSKAAAAPKRAASPQAETTTEAATTHQSQPEQEPTQTTKTAAKEAKPSTRSPRRRRPAPAKTEADSSAKGTAATEGNANPSAKPTEAKTPAEKTGTRRGFPLRIARIRKRRPQNVPPADSRAADSQAADS